jgi:hypothetical protein
MAANRSHAMQTPSDTDPSSQFADTFRNPIHKHHADDFANEINEIAQLEHGLMMALREPNVKTGKCGYAAAWAK